jgi:DNA-binding HxlR family transcriptional regulator
VTKRHTLPSGEPISDEACREATSIVGIATKRWTGGVLLALGRGATRFSQMEALVEGISARMLSARLRELEQHHLLERMVTPTTPVSVQYYLTPRGQNVLASLNNLAVHSIEAKRDVA